MSSVLEDMIALKQEALREAEEARIREQQKREHRRKELVQMCEDTYQAYLESLKKMIKEDPHYTVFKRTVTIPKAVASGEEDKVFREMLRQRVLKDFDKASTKFWDEPDRSGFGHRDEFGIEVRIPNG